MYKYMFSAYVDSLITRKDPPVIQSTCQNEQTYLVSACCRSIGMW